MSTPGAPHRGQPVTTAVFDLGGVLIDWDPRHLYRRVFAGDEAAMETFLATVCTPEWNARQDAGRPWAEGIAALVAEHPEERERILLFRERWDEMLGGAIEGTLDLLGELRRRGVPCYALTNWSAETFPVARERYPFLGWFEGIVVSGEERVGKPDPLLFEILFARHGIDPRRAFYVDDNPANVAVAGRLGMRAVLFEGPAALRGALEAAGLLDGVRTRREG